jgi:hypothetical protein
MILSLTILFALEATNLASILVAIHSEKTLFFKVMSLILSTVYGVTILIYIPLFWTVMERLRVAFPVVHAQIKSKVNIAFTFLIVLLFIRYAIYLSLQFANIKFFDISELRAYVPFYISELIISVAYIFFLIKVYKNKEIEIIDPQSESFDST